jgi:protein-tyrosine phosphatase
LGDFVDLHIHAMFGFDDGAAALEETREIIRLAAQAGFGTVVATPHVMVGVYEHDRAKLNDAIAALGPELASLETPVRVLPGAEYYLDEHFAGRLERGELYPLGAGKHVLVELPMLRIPPLARDFAFKLRIKGMIPILAHPERYGDVTRSPERAVELREAGYLIQLNLGSLVGMYGRGPRKAAEWLLKKNQVDFVGSDAHTPKQAEQTYGEGLAALRHVVGDEGLRRLLVDNASAAVAGPVKNG